MKKITKAGLTSAESDLLIIDRITGEPQLTHQLAFHAQQAVEKSFKAIIEEYELGFIKSHSLETLYSKVEQKITLSFDQDIILLLDQLYIDARYPGELGLLPFGKPSLEEAKNFYMFARYANKAIVDYLNLST